MIDKDEFLELKKKYLNKSGLLDEQAIKEIRRLFGGDTNGMVSCDDAHAHFYRCDVYDNPEAGIVERLLIERDHYRDILKDINKQTKLD